MAEAYFQNKNILLISPENWDHLFVSKHHYAIELAKKNLVYFLNPPKGKYTCEQTKYHNLWQIRYKPFIKGLRFLPKFIQRFFMQRKFKKIQQLANVEFDCVWSFDNSVFFDFSFLPSAVLRISHIVDHSQDFQLGKAAATADFCMGVSKNIVKKLSAFNKVSFLVPHGIAVSNEEPRPVKLPGANSIKVVYAGNLDSPLINTELLFQLLDKNPNVDFVFFGTGGLAWTPRGNMHLAGRVSYEKLKDYLTSADLLLMIYDEKKFPEQLTNAHKILEYLYAGKVVVSNFVSDYAKHSSLIQMAKSDGDFLILFSEVIANLPFYNDPQKINERRRYALNNSYTQRIMDVEAIIQNIPYHSDFTQSLL